MQYRLQLTAGLRQTLEYSGRYLMIEDTGAASTLDIRLKLPGAPDEDIPLARRGFKARMGSRFDRLEIVAPVDCTAQLLVSENAVDADFSDGSRVTVVNDALQPVPVSNDRGSPGNLMHVTAVTAADTPATGATSAGPVACSPVAAVVAAANPNTRELRMLNLGPDPVAIGPAGITWAQRAIVLEVGDVWVETRAANLAWSAITDAGKTAAVNVQRVNV